MLIERMGSSPISSTMISKTNRNKSCFLSSFLYSWQRSSLLETRWISLLRQDAYTVRTTIAAGAVRPIFIDREQALTSRRKEHIMRIDDDWEKRERLKEGLAKITKKGKYKEKHKGIRIRPVI